MEILLDTCTFLWWTLGSGEIPEATAKVLRDPSHRVYLSAASAWEIALKRSIGRLPLPTAPDRWIPEQRERHFIEPLPVAEREAAHVAKLPLLHRDPFDRMLVAQSICYGLDIATPDGVIHRYPCRTLWRS